VLCVCVYVCACVLVRVCLFVCVRACVCNRRQSTNTSCSHICLLLLHLWSQTRFSFSHFVLKGFLLRVRGWRSRIQFVYCKKVLCYDLIGWTRSDILNLVIVSLIVVKDQRYIKHYKLSLYSMLSVQYCSLILIINNFLSRTLSI